MWNTAVDIDGILCDFAGQVWIPAFEETLGFEATTIDDDAYHMHLRYAATEDECLSVWNNHEAMACHIRAAEPIRGTLSHVKNMDKSKIILLTARGTHGTLAESEPIRSATRDWVSSVFGDDAPPVVFVPSDDKVSFCIRNGISTIYDDKPSIVLEALENKMEAYSLKWSYNRQLHDNGMVRFLDWEEDELTPRERAYAR